MDHNESRFGGQVFAAVGPEKVELPLVRGLNASLLKLGQTFPALELRELVTVLLMAELSQEQDAFPSLRYLAERLRCTPAVARSSIRAVERAGIVQRTARFATSSTGGVRQTSNRYRLLEPSRARPRSSRPIDVLEDAVDPRQLELSKDHDAWEGRSPAIDAPTPVDADVVALLAPDPESLATLCEVVPPERDEPPLEASAVLPVPVSEPPAPSALVEAPPLLPSVAPPYCPAQGIEELRVKRKANSTRAKALTPGDVSPNHAAAFLDPVLSPELSRALKLRFGLVAFASVLYALKRNVCKEHPEVATRALKRLLEAADVHNPGAYFFRVFSAELEAWQLLPKPSPEDLLLERERERAEALRSRQKALQAQLERVQCADWEAAGRVRAELEAVQRERRRRHAPEPQPSPGHASGAAEVLSAAEQQAQAERVLAMLRGRTAAA